MRPKPAWLCNYIHATRLSSCDPVVLACNWATYIGGRGRERGEGRVKNHTFGIWSAPSLAKARRNSS